MKTSFIILATLFFINASAQVVPSARIGMKTKPASPVVSIGMDIIISGFVCAPEMIVDIANSEPVNFGAKAGYQYHVSKDISMQAGAGIFYQLYSTDAYDKERNGFISNFYLDAQCKQLFGQLEYMNCLRLSIGMRIKLNNK